MLGCFVGAAETAARGVPERFVGKPISGVTVKREAVNEKEKEQEKQKTTEADSKEEAKSKPDSATPATGQGSSAAEPMAVDA